MARRLLVSDGTSAKEVTTNYKVAQTGLVQRINRALVAEAGIARQYWPKQAASTDPDILWDNFPLTVTKYETLVNQPAISSITFIADGSYVYSDDTSVNDQNSTFANWLDATVTGAGQYLIKADLVSGTFGGSTLGVWIDAFTPPSYTLTRAITGGSQGILNISVAKGSVTPDAGTEVLKQVTFNAIIQDEGTKVSWSNVPQWDIEEIKTTPPADCVLTFNPNGTASGHGDTSGTFNQNWHEDATIVPDPENFTVQVNVVSGTAPSGSATGAPLSLAAVRQWTLNAPNADDNFSCELDVIVGDGVAFTTKRVTMHSEVGTTPTDNVWTATPWFLNATSFEPDSATSAVRLNPDGTALGEQTGNAPLTQDWHSEAPAASDPENYEAMCVVTAGSAPELTGPAINVWHSLSIQLLWQLITEDEAGGFNSESGEWEIRIRRVGQPSVNKPVTILNSVEPGEGGIPQ